MPPRKSSSTPRKRTPRKTTPPRQREQPDPSTLDREALKEVVERVAPSRPPTEEERQAKLTAYTALKSAGVPIPDELAQEVEGWIEAENARRQIEAAEQAKRQTALDEENKKGPFWVRNGYTAPFSLRLDRQHEARSRRIELKPRGVPGDMHPLEEADLNDPLIKRNCAIGVIEIVPNGEANRIMAQQTTNMGTRVHTPTAILRNSLGEEYPEGAVKTEIEWGKQGVVVATLDPNQMQGHIEDKRVAVTRVQQGEPRQEMVSEFIPTGGNPAIVSQQPMTEMQRLKIQDDIARRKGTSGPSAGLGQGVTVTVEPSHQVVSK